MPNRSAFPCCPADDALPSSAVPATGMLDAVALGKLRELDPGGQTGVVRRVLGAFETSLARLMEQFAQARASGDDAGLRHVAHTLKSSAASIGALELSRCCHEVESLLREGRPGQSPEMTAKLDAIVVEGARAGAAVRTMLVQP